MRDDMHCYWAHDKPHLLIGLNTGVALCGERGVLKARLTCIASAVSCRRCRKIRMEQRRAVEYKEETPLEAKKGNDVKRGTRDSKAPRRVKFVGRKNKRK